MVFHPSSLDSATVFVVAMAPLGAGALPLLEAVGKWLTWRRKEHEPPTKIEPKWLSYANCRETWETVLLGMIIENKTRNSIEKEHHLPNQPFFWRSWNRKDDCRAESLCFGTLENIKKKSDTRRARLCCFCCLPTVWAWTTTMRICCTYIDLWWFMWIFEAWDVSLAMIYEFLQRLNNGNNTSPPRNYAVQHKNVSASMTTLRILKKIQISSNLVRCSTNKLTNVQKTLRSFTSLLVKWWFPKNMDTPNHWFPMDHNQWFGW